MGEYRCKICDDKLACRAVDEELEKGMTGTGVARLMTLRGFKVDDSTVREHNKHRRPSAPPGVAKTQKDLAIIIRDKMLSKVEGDTFDVLDKEMQPALKTGLQAQKLLDTRAARADDKKMQFVMAQLLLGGGPAGLLAPGDLRGDVEGEEDDDEDIIEGEATQVE